METVLDHTTGALVERAGPACSYRRREAIYYQGDAYSGLYWVASGVVLLEQFDAFGNQTAFRLAMPGEFFGYRSLFAEEPHAATAIALKPSRVRACPPATVREQVRRDPAVAIELLKLLARDPGPVQAPMLRSPYLPVRVRLAHLLILLRERCASDDGHGGLVYSLPVQRGDIAAMLGTRIETVARTIRALEGAGVATFAKGRRVHVPEPERLYEAAGLALPQP